VFRIDRVESVFPKPIHQQIPPRLSLAGKISLIRNGMAEAKRKLLDIRVAEQSFLIVKLNISAYNGASFTMVLFHREREDVRDLFSSYMKSTPSFLVTAEC